MNDKLFEKMSNENAPAILLPFARAIITSFTAQANIPPIILPLLNLTKSKE
ncbi:protein-export chaperone SecB [bacterium]|nr:protein-export chaperone SecB [bacterium]